MNHVFKTIHYQIMSQLTLVSGLTSNWEKRRGQKRAASSFLDSLLFLLRPGLWLLLIVLGVGSLSFGIAQNITIDYDIPGQAATNGAANPSGLGPTDEVIVDGVDGITSSDGSVTISTNHANSNGGGFYLGSGNPLTLKGTVTFDNNTAKRTGGALYTASGMITLDTSTNDSNISFISNRVEQGAPQQMLGGAIYAHETTNLNIVQQGAHKVTLLFDNNYSRYRGGAISSARDGKNAKEINIILSNGEMIFTNNRAYDTAGAIHGGNKPIRLEASHNIEFANNIAETKKGGAVYAYEGTGEISLTSHQGDVIFKDNKAAISGGAIHTHRDVTINAGNNIIFEDNKLTATNATYGGGIDSHANVTLDAGNNLIATGNTAGQQISGGSKPANAGGGFISAYKDVTLEASNKFEVSNDKAKGYGGAIYGESVTIVNKVKGDDSEFSGNVSEREGGAIHIAGGAFVLDTVSNITFKGNQAGVVDLAHPIPSDGQQGEAVYLSGQGASAIISVASGQVVDFQDTFISDAKNGHTFTKKGKGIIVFRSGDSADSSRINTFYGETTVEDRGWGVPFDG